MNSKRYPFKFLDAYTREDSDFFFGRDEEINAMYEMIFQTRLLLVYGASGTGKTSLINCGLASKFQSHDWLDIYIRRGSNINTSFQNALLVAGDNLEKSNEYADLIGTKPNQEKQFGSIVTDSPLAIHFNNIYLNHFKPIYLIFDQFEELYILGNKEEQVQFISTVKEILRIEQPVKVIISIREEYLGHLYEFEKEVPQLLRKKLRIDPMNLDKVKGVIKGIGNSEISNVLLKKGEEELIATKIFEKIRGDEKSLTIQLPYLQVFLDKLYLDITHDENRITEAELTLEELKKTGDIGDVLHNFLDKQLLLTANTLNQTPESIWLLLTPFVTIDGTKKPLRLEQLADKHLEVSIDLIEKILNTFVKSRILRFTETEQQYEIAHDSLAKHIYAHRSADEIATMDAERVIKSQFELNPNLREYFTEKQIEFVTPYLHKIKLKIEEKEWIDLSRNHIQQENMKRQDQEKHERKKKLLFFWTKIGLALLAGLIFISYLLAENNNKTMEIAIKENEKRIISEQLANEQRIDSLRAVAANFLVGFRVYFKLTEFELGSESIIQLDSLVNFLKLAPMIEIEIVGRADRSEPEKYNLVYSKNRARGVYEYLLENGIIKDRMKWMGIGYAEPLQDNNTKNIQKINCSVEIKITQF